MASIKKKAKNHPKKEHILGKEIDLLEFKFELRRQAFHLLLGLVTVTLFYYNVLITPIFMFLVLVFGFILSYIAKSHKIPVISSLINFFERPDERTRFPGRGALFFTAGVLLVIELFPKDVAIVSILILAVGDSVSHIIGRYFGRTKNPFLETEKLLEGTLAGSLVAFPIAVLFAPSIPWWHILLACFGAMFVEAIELEANKREVDDNIIVPLAAGAILLLLRIYI